MVAVQDRPLSGSSVRYILPLHRSATCPSPCAAELAQKTPPYAAIIVDDWLEEMAVLGRQDSGGSIIA